MINYAKRIMMLNHFIKHAAKYGLLKTFRPMQHNGLIIVMEVHLVLIKKPMLDRSQQHFACNASLL
ncbi:hypothetical protein D3C74_454760 [compost metagenome]